MGRIVKGVLILLLLVIPSVAYGGIAYSLHDLRLTAKDMWGFYAANNYGEICVYCHTPHGANNIAPLWNKNTPPAIGSYTMYK